MAKELNLGGALVLGQDKAGEKYDPSKATYAKGRFGKVTVPLNNKVYYTPTLVLSNGISPVIPFAFSTAVHGVQHATPENLELHQEIQFFQIGFITEEIAIPEGIKNYIELNKENLKKTYQMVAWDKLL